MKLLLKKGADPECEDKDGLTPLLVAAGNGHEAAVKLLLEEGADPEFKNYYGDTPLLLAMENGHEAVVRLLLDPVILKKTSRTRLAAVR